MAPQVGGGLCSSQFENNCLAEVWSGFEEGSYLRLMFFLHHSTLGWGADLVNSVEVEVIALDGRRLLLCLLLLLLICPRLLCPRLLFTRLLWLRLLPHVLCFLLPRRLLRLLFPAPLPHGLQPRLLSPLRLRLVLTRATPTSVFPSLTCGF